MQFSFLFFFYLLLWTRLLSWFMSEPFQWDFLKVIFQNSTFSWLRNISVMYNTTTVRLNMRLTASTHNFSLLRHKMCLKYDFQYEKGVNSIIWKFSVIF